MWVGAFLGILVGLIPAYIGWADVPRDSWFFWRKSYALRNFILRKDGFTFALALLLELAKPAAVYAFSYAATGDALLAEVSAYGCFAGQAAFWNTKKMTHLSAVAPFALGLVFYPLLTLVSMVFYYGVDAWDAFRRWAPFVAVSFLCFGLVFVSYQPQSWALLAFCCVFLPLWALKLLRY